MSGDAGGAADSPRVFFPPPLVFLAAFGLGWLLDRRWPWQLATDDRTILVARGAGALLAAGGVALAAWALARFRRAGTSPLPHRAATAMVAAGPYRLTRNPMYLGMTAVLAGAGLALARGWIVLSTFVAAFLVDRAVIAREERYLERAFGDDYRAYKRRVRRWL